MRTQLQTTCVHTEVSSTYIQFSVAEKSQVALIQLGTECGSSNFRVGTIPRQPTRKKVLDSSRDESEGTYRRGGEGGEEKSLRNRDP